MEPETIMALYEIAGALLDGYLAGNEPDDHSSLMVTFREAGYAIILEVRREH